MKKEILTLALLGLLAGCSSQPSLHYYSLDGDNQQPVTAPAQPQHQLVLRPVALASQLDRISLVYQLEGQELHFTEYHRW
ncbi:MAG: PqiC family protein, partial [Aeromonas veronii]